jgi:hypothetical protein
VYAGYLELEAWLHACAVLGLARLFQAVRGWDGCRAVFGVLLVVAALCVYGVFVAQSFEVSVGVAPGTP